jgi:hypothetical protein
MMPDIPAALREEFDRHRELAGCVFDKQPASIKAEAMSAIKEQAAVFKRLFEKCNDSEKAAIQSYVLDADMPLLNKTTFATVKGIAFCAVFSPLQHPVAYVAARRLWQISQLERQLIKWYVISADASDSVYGNDEPFAFYFATQQFEVLRSLSGFSYFDISTHISWGEAAALEAFKMPSFDYIYSRSSPPASHIPAIRYKRENPAAQYFAEFSDPISISHQNTKKEVSPEIVKTLGFTNNYHEDIELSIYEIADKIIFTNDNQYQLMHSYCPNGSARKHMENKRVISAHPTSPIEFGSIIDSNYSVRDEAINIAYFGIWLYENRNLACFFELAERQDINLHIFSPKYEKSTDWTPPDRLQINEVISHLDCFANRTFANEQVSNLELLNIASKMDYLYVEDMDFPGPINPYLPSKLADYLSTGTKIIAKVQEGSAMSKIEHPNIIKISEVTQGFLASLRKNASSLNSDE